MAKKVAQVDIKIGGLNTIADLENYLQEINSELKQIDVNSDKFKTLSSNAAAAQSKLATINTELKGVTAQEKTDAIKKMGEGLVGAFQVGAGASLLFGEKTGEAMNKVIGQVAGLYSAVDGLDKISKAFSTQNINALKAVGAQFKLAGNQAKLFGLSMRTALITSGIGIFLVALTAVAANWDRITAAIKRNNAEKKRAEEIKVLEGEVKYAEDVLGLTEKRVAEQKKLNTLNGETEKNDLLDLEVLRKRNELLTAQYTQSKAALDELAIKKEKEKFEVEEINAMGKSANENFGKAQKDRYKATTEQYELDAANVALLKQQQELVDKQLTTYQEILDTKESIDTKDKDIAKYKNQNDLLTAQGNKYFSIYENNKKIIDLEKQKINLQIKLNGEITTADEIALAGLNNQRKVLEENKNKFLEQLQKEKEQYVNAKTYREKINALTKEYQYVVIQGANQELDINKILARRNKILDENQTINDKLVEALDIAKTSYQEYNAIVNEGAQFDIRRNKLMEIAYQDLLPNGVKITKEAYTQFESLLLQTQKYAQAVGMQLDENLMSTDAISKLIADNIDSSREEIQNSAEGVRLNKDKLEQAANELAIVKTIAIVSMGKLTVEKQVLSITQDALNKDNERLTALKIIEEAEKTRIQAAIDLLQAEKDKGVNLEREVEINKEITTLVNEQSQNANNIISIQNEMVANNADLLETSTQINLVDTETAAIKDETLATQQALTASVAEQSGLLQGLPDFVKKYAEEIQAAQDVMNALFEFAAVKQDEIAKDADNKIKESEKKLDKLNKKQEKSNDRLKDLQEELKDADGERYNQLLDLIAQEQAANIENGKTTQQLIIEEEAANKKLQNDKMRAEYEAAKIRKRQALVDAAIQTALAVIKALPNVILSIAAGVAGGIGIATIASKKIEEPQYLASGGLLQGASHAEGGIPINAEGGEFVINKRSTSQYMPLLEAINDSGRQKFANGGQVSNTPAVSTGNSNEIFDYARLAAELSKLNMTVSVVDINKGQNRVRVIEGNASI